MSPEQDAVPLWDTEDDTIIYNCRCCGRDLPPGGTRRIGVCVDCIATRSYAPRRVRSPRYGTSAPIDEEP